MPYSIQLRTKVQVPGNASIVPHRITSSSAMLLLMRSINDMLFFKSVSSYLLSSGANVNPFKEHVLHKL